MSNGSKTYTEETLPKAIGNLLELNNYRVEYDVHVHGAQIDLVAHSLSDPFSSPLYIEATIEYVSNDKYGKDATKFLLIKSIDQSANCLCISSSGFTASVKERAANSGVLITTYDELFAKFEKFSPYVDQITKNQDAIKLVKNYEEPLFKDSKGTEFATKWLSYWRSYSPDAARWLIVLGEYGTGKTSLTRVLQYRWLQDYRSDPSNPIPVRVELRNFSRQFDARGLMHHFLDTSALGHVSMEFMLHLIRTGRVILLLDGYDEMAQFLNARERRACLSALAEFASQGAKGILTSRPNYFTESEELNVFEALYATIEQSRYHLSQVDRSFIVEEKLIDNLVEKYILNRYERILQDLTPEQTESLVVRSLSDDPKGQEIVLSILKKIFRDETAGGKQSLSGKPVIIAYLLELIEDIRNSRIELDVSSLTEWQVYKLIVDRLMLRDLRRSTLNPGQRRRSLQKLAIALSGRDAIVANETTFLAVIDDEFRAELRVMQADERRARREELFEDLRSSATLTRASGTRTDGWVFSHNSLREYLATEFFLESLAAKAPGAIRIPVSPAMRGFAASISELEMSILLASLSELWPSRSAANTLGMYLSLVWDGARRQPEGLLAVLSALTQSRSKGGVTISGISLKSLDFSSDFSGAHVKIEADGTELSEVIFDEIDLNGSSFLQSTLDTVSFKGCNLRGCIFRGALLFECDLTRTDIRGADFSEIDEESNFVASNEGGTSSILSGKLAVGYLKYHGAVTDAVDEYFVLRNHPKFSIVEKIFERISEQRNSQLRGLTQRGEARSDPPFARQLVDRLVSEGLVHIDRNDLVSATSDGRNVLSKVVSHNILPDFLVQFLSEY